MTEFETFIEVLENRIKRLSRSSSLQPINIQDVLELAKQAKKIHQKRADREFETLNNGDDHIWGM